MRKHQLKQETADVHAISSLKRHLVMNPITLVFVHNILTRSNTWLHGLFTTFSHTYISEKKIKKKKIKPSSINSIRLVHSLDLMHIWGKNKVNVLITYKPT